MAKYVFPAVFTKEDNGYSVIFPDVKNCYTGAETLADAMERAEDVLQMMLADAEEEGNAIPTPTPIRDISVDENSFVSPILCDTANEALVDAAEESGAPKQFDLLVSLLLEMLKSGNVQKVIDLLEETRSRA